MTVKAAWHIVKEATRNIGVAKLAPHDLRHYAAWKTMPSLRLNALWLAGFLFDDSASFEVTFWYAVNQEVVLYIDSFRNLKLC